MATQQKIHMPGAFGGLMRYDDEIQSRFIISPAVVVGFVIALVGLILVLKIVKPVV